MVSLVEYRQAICYEDLNNSFITDWNGSDKLVFHPVPSWRLGTLAALRS